MSKLAWKQDAQQLRENDQRIEEVDELLKQDEVVHVDDAAADSPALEALDYLALQMRAHDQHEPCFNHIQIQGGLQVRPCLGLVGSDLVVPLSAQFCQGSWKSGRIGMAAISNMAELSNPSQQNPGSDLRNHPVLLHC